MANTASARKRARQSEKRRKHNVSCRSMLRSSVKKVIRTLDANDAAAAAPALQAATSLLDRMAGRGLIHPNKAARHKSRLTRRLKALAAAPA